MSGDPALPKLPEAGAIIDDKYEIVGVVGKGGMGVVFEAIHLRVRGRVALKMLHPFLLDVPGVIERFEREARAAGQLCSPNIAKVLDVETKNTAIPYIVMEFLEGRDLGEELAIQEQLPIEDAVDYVLQACSAMREAHAAGIVHRDLKPANLFLCPSPEGPVIKILDFGISKITTETDGRLTAAMTTVGSPVYMSPEQLRGASDVGPRADIWGLGIILYELIAGRPPHTGTVTSVTASIIGDALRPLSSYRSEVPPAFDEVVAKALSKDPADRWADADAFAEALAPFGSPESVRRLRARLALLVPTPPSSRRVVNQDKSAETAIAPASALSTRHAFTTAAGERALRSKRSRMQGLLVVGAAVVVLGIAVATIAQRGSGAPKATGNVGAVATPPVASVPGFVATPVQEPANAAAAPVGIPTASSIPPSTTSTPSTSSTARAPSTKAGPPRGAPPASTKNPLHL